LKYQLIVVPIMLMIAVSGIARADESVDKQTAGQLTAPTQSVKQGSAESSVGFQIPMVDIPAGQFISGSNTAERERAYQLDEEAYGHSATRTQRWYENEQPRSWRHTNAFSIMKTPVTVNMYRHFLQASGHVAPVIDRDAWQAQRLRHSYDSTLKYQWREDTSQQGRDQHPVVMVTHTDAVGFARWVSEETGVLWRLPNQHEWEKAARGIAGRTFPWGNTFDPHLLNSHDKGPFETVDVGQFEQGESVFGMSDAAGQVFEWTASLAGSDKRRAIVKGGSWDDKGCGVCRPAARHTRPIGLRHILIGFRLVTDGSKYRPD